MSRSNLNRLSIAASAVLLAALSCVTTPGAAPPIVAVDNEAQSLIQDACNATPYLNIDIEITLEETNQFGTRACEYKLVVFNTSDKPLRIYAFQHDQDGYALTDKTRWMGNLLVEPSQAGEWPGSVYIYTDPDADGPLMSIPLKIAGVFDSPECAEERQDESFFEQVAVPVGSVCPEE